MDSATTAFLIYIYIHVIKKNFYKRMNISIGIHPRIFNEEIKCIVQYLDLILLLLIGTEFVIEL